MASRLYRNTLPLFLAVEQLLLRLGFAQLGTPTLFGLLALYVTGLILLDERPTQTRVSARLPARAHDALNRLLRSLPLSTRALLRLLIRFAAKRGQEGYLLIDEVLIEKEFARKLPWAAWIYSATKQRYMRGMVLVVLVWCSDDGRWRIPVGFRLWRPKERCSKADYRTKLELAQVLVHEVLLEGLPVRYVVFDTHYTAGWFTRWLTRRGLVWQGTLDPKTTVVYLGVKGQVRDMARTLKLKWRPKLGVCAQAFDVYAPKYGHLRLCVTRNRHGNCEYIVSNAASSDLSSMVGAKRSRWSVETVFRDTKQFAGFEDCQCRVDQAMVRHVALVFITFVVLQLLRHKPDENVGEVKERWQLTVLRAGERPPPPLRCAPPEFRATA